ncbi:hypothetical protein HD553DRAFT_261706, partial [Filobasidium floriforme]|uniref:uncharacterized protein n=1 Tax=Filobasidium floriforme TaxID=5210 RepID=UPI001E8D0BF2
RGGNEASNPGMNLHVSGLSRDVGADDLNKRFGEVGTVDKASVMYDPHTKESRGFGFVMMVDADGAARAIAELNGKEFMGKVMTVAHV